MFLCNCRRYEAFCCMLATWFPRTFITGLYCYGLYAYCLVLCLKIIGGWTGLFLSLSGAWLAFQGLYTYFVVLRGPGSPLDFPELRVLSDTEADLESGMEPPTFLTNHSVQIKQNGGFRFCKKCRCWKPDRSHHCSGCQRCHLKMDHHCPWFSTCIGFQNHKFFIQFLIITVLYTTLILLVAGYQVWMFFKNEEYQDEFLSLHALALALIGLCFSISTGVFTAITVYFMSRNLTTIEYYDYHRYRNNLNIINDAHYRYSSQPSSKELGNLYDLGTKRNLQVVMGMTWKEWLLPVENKPMYDDHYQNEGVFFEYNPEVYNALKNNSDLQNRLLGELYRASTLH